MPVVLGKQKGKRALGKRKNVGCLKDPVEETLVLPVVIRVHEVGHWALLCPQGKKRMTREGRSLVWRGLSRPWKDLNVC